MSIDKDCCDNCIEGIEPCCDEELQQHIETQLVEQTTPEQPTQFVNEEKAYDNLAKELAPHLCCIGQFFHIERVMENIDNVEEVKNLRDNLRKYTNTGFLHSHLESRFRNKIAELDSFEILSS